MADCTDCGQPMLPPGEPKRPNEYDHASGCPKAPLTVKEWQKRRRAIISSRAGCECPNAFDDGRIVPASQYSALKTADIEELRTVSRATEEALTFAARVRRERTSHEVSAAPKGGSDG